MPGAGGHGKEILISAGIDSRAKQKIITDLGEITEAVEDLVKVLNQASSGVLGVGAGPGAGGTAVSTSGAGAGAGAGAGRPQGAARPQGLGGLGAVASQNSAAFKNMAKDSRDTFKQMSDDLGRAILDQIGHINRLEKKLGDLGSKYENLSGMDPEDKYFMWHGGEDPRRRERALQERGRRVAADRDQARDILDRIQERKTAVDSVIAAPPAGAEPGLSPAAAAASAAIPGGRALSGKLSQVLTSAGVPGAKGIASAAASLMGGAAGTAVGVGAGALAAGAIVAHGTMTHLDRQILEGMRGPAALGRSGGAVAESMRGGDLSLHLAAGLQDDVVRRNMDRVRSTRYMAWQGFQGAMRGLNPWGEYGLNPVEGMMAGSAEGYGNRFDVLRESTQDPRRKDIINRVQQYYNEAASRAAMSRATGWSEERIFGTAKEHGTTAAEVTGAVSGVQQFAGRGTARQIAGQALGAQIAGVAGASAFGGMMAVGGNLHAANQLHNLTAGMDVTAAAMAGQIIAGTMDRGILTGGQGLLGIFEHAFPGGNQSHEDMRRAMQMRGGIAATDRLFAGEIDPWQQGVNLLAAVGTLGPDATIQAQTFMTERTTRELAELAAADTPEAWAALDPTMRKAMEFHGITQEQAQRYAERVMRSQSGRTIAQPGTRGSYEEIRTQLAEHGESGRAWLEAKTRQWREEGLEGAALRTKREDAVRELGFFRAANTPNLSIEDAIGQAYVETGFGTRPGGRPDEARRGRATDPARGAAHAALGDMADAAMNVTKSLKELSIQLALSQEDGSILSAAAQRAGVTGSGVVLGGGLTEAAQQMSDEIGEAPAAQQLGSLQEKQVELLRELVANAEAMKRAQAAAQAALEQWRRNMIRNPGGTAVRTGQAAVRAAVNAAFGERTQSPESE